MQNLKITYWYRTFVCHFTKFTNPQSIRLIRKSSNFRRPQTNLLPFNVLDELKGNLLQNHSTFTNTDWQDVKKTLMNNFKHVNENNVDAIILGVCSEAEYLPLAKGYIQHLRSIGVQPNAATLGRLLRVYNTAYHARGANCTSLTPDEKLEISGIYEGLKQKYDILDATSCENLIYGLVATEQWHKAEQLLEMIKLTCTPTVGAYTALAAKAFSMGHIELGWRLLNEMIQHRKQPKCEVYITYLNEISKRSSSHSFRKEFEKLLTFLGTNELIPTEKVIQHLELIAKGTKISNAFKGLVKTHVNHMGKCNNCNTYMENITISDEDFAKLSDSFLHRVLIRSDVFQKSTPQEVEQFKRFVEKTAPYDCVVDGLNVAYSMGSKKPPHILANLLCSVVKYFNMRNKHVLVLGRKHMNNWPANSMQYIRNNASVFLTNNLSHDDPFLLYAAIKSGKSTDFFSRDLMRTHAYLLGAELKMIFRRWQQEHQYSLVTQTQSGKIIIKEPIRHLIYAHKVKENTWHLPYKQEYTVNAPDTFENPEQWLCIKFQK